MRFSQLFLSVLATLGIAASASAAEWFVSTTGSDSSGNGSIAAPFRTVGHVLDRSNGIVTAGDTVTLRGPAGNNTYNECEVRLRLPLTLRSRPGERAHIHCDLSVIDSVAIQIDPGASGSRISNLEVSGGYYYTLFFQTDWEREGNPTGTGASDVIVEDCILRDSGRDTIKITPKSDRITIRRCEIHHSGRIYPPGTSPDNMNAEGIDNVNGSRMIVEDSYIHDTATTGVYFKGGAADVIVQRNVVERTGEGGILAGFDTSPEFFDTALNPGYYEAIRGIVRNNIVRDTRRAGIGLYASRDTLIANNTIQRTATVSHAAIYFGVTLQDYDPAAGRPANLNPRVLNNLIRQNGGDCVGIRYSNDLGGLSGLSGVPGSNYNWFDNSTGACAFSDSRPASAFDGNLAQWQQTLNADANSRSGLAATAADGRLVAGSAAINAGTTVAEVSDDIDRQARAAPYDIGADEFGSGILPTFIFRHGFE